MEFKNLDYHLVSKDRVTHQFKDSLNVDRLSKVWNGGFQEAQEALLDITNINNVDTALGKNLGVIGDIVGQPRGLLQISTKGYFGFLQDTGAKTFGSFKNDKGGVYYSLDDPVSGNVKLNDIDYRLFVKSKIILNNTGGTPEDIIAAAKYIFQTDIVELFEGGTDPDETAVMTLNIGRAWNDPDTTLFPDLDETVIADRLLPVPVGVRIEYTDVNVSETLGPVNYWWNIASLNLYSTANTTLPSNLGTL
jgi:hypothetical protein